MLRLFAVLSVCVFLCACATDSSLLRATAATAPPLPQASRIVVLKGERKLYLEDVNGRMIRGYDMTLGGDPVGPKQCEGDMKTPEGRYYIEGRNPDSKYHRSLKISYPAPEDVARAESLGRSPGGDIFIHGAPNDALFNGFFYNFKKEWTLGCIALSNRDIDELWTLVGDGTPVDIYP